MKEGIRTRFLNLVNNPLVIGVFFSLYVFVVRFLVYPRYKYLVEGDFSLISDFIEWFGVVYGLFIALVLVEVWQQFETVEREFDREADAISTLYQSASLIDDTEGTKEKQLKDEIITGIKDYVAHVIDHFKQEHRNLTKKEAGDQKLETIRKAIGTLVHTGEKESLTSELLRGYSEAADLRGDRISHSKQHILTPLWNISVAISVLWLIPFYGLDFKSPIVAVFLIGGVTVIVVAILVIIKDLDDVFEGNWKIDIADWKALGEKIGLKPSLYLVYDLDSSRLSTVRAFIDHWRSKRLCALYSLLMWNKQRENFFETLDQVSYLEQFYKDEFAERYGEDEVLPIVICKSNSTKKVIVTSDEISRVSTLMELGILIRERVNAFPSQGPMGESTTAQS